MNDNTADNNKIVIVYVLPFSILSLSSDVYRNTLDVVSERGGDAIRSYILRFN